MKKLIIMSILFLLALNAKASYIGNLPEIRLSADSGTTFFDHVMISSKRAAGNLAPSGTEFIFNAGTRISASIRAYTGGGDTLKIWLKLQSI